MPLTPGATVMKHGDATPTAQRRRLAELHRLLAQWSGRTQEAVGEDDESGLAELQAAINKACGR